jgi:hypothetical protein
LYCARKVGDKRVNRDTYFMNGAPRPLGFARDTSREDFHNCRIRYALPRSDLIAL